MACSCSPVLIACRVVVAHLSTEVPPTHVLPSTPNGNCSPEIRVTPKDGAQGCGERGQTRKAGDHNMVVVVVVDIVHLIK
jgi:hypothetical protein